MEYPAVLRIFRAAIDQNAEVIFELSEAVRQWPRLANTMERKRRDSESTASRRRRAVAGRDRLGPSPGEPAAGGAHGEQR